jgi:hypothetical protein
VLPNIFSKLNYNLFFPFFFLNGAYFYWIETCRSVQIRFFYQLKKNSNSRCTRIQTFWTRGGGGFKKGYTKKGGVPVQLSPD